ncbi:MAG: heme-binding protein [Firmicutes bacterium]|nr:heme-binding protein [Bacillota bacterium]
MNKKIYEVADKLIEAGIEKAKEIGVNMVLAVVDDGGNLVAFRRMEDSFLISIDVAQGKAFSGAALRMPTSVLAGAVQPGAEIYGMEMARPGKIITFGGGYPLFSDGELIGGFGMSGGSAEEDMICAEYAISKVDGVSLEK